ncbi:MAG: cation:proton antiporter [Paraclostridium sordellii]|uniref:Cell volume regulation protein A n=1 Tax=Paraclostridium sordellii TaxID=1505 RepID=A0A0A1SGG5_PARSO|nr:cation:proton antiporter [Paeniclostridium sordellii]CEJ72572.1 cell volume regulation protein A [[Clostridium] sordellii] [Paeniclostridium sordellii]CEK34669.1 Na(+)/H(+) antiporter,potassium/proton antiporter,NhaP-type Na+/H+ and K+/H+ antiporters with a unique C-terminal domain,sodium/hydrogen exchanger 3,Sodium/hydrogen exchanger family [[Clostridium] sordellii] [Paeniclostridium sordellii]CEN68125.1 Na()/H() antiporter [[Clostridium] sordellii] [Paeniclostridium sordellii]CEN71392.1 Na
MENTMEAIATNNLLIIFSAIVITGIILGKLSEKLKIPDVILYLIAGIVIGPAVLNLISVDSFPIENNLILTFGSAFILYEGGREVNLKVLNKVKVSVGLLATLGVIISTVVVGFATNKIFGLPVMTSLLVGGIIASTDPAALIPVFKQVSIKEKIKQTVVSESAFNDAVGAIIVSTLLTIVTSGSFSVGESAKELLIAVFVGVIIGVLVGYVFSVLISDKKWGIFHSYAPIISILKVVLAYELATLLHGSGYMAVFIVGLIAGNKKLFGLWVPEEDFQSEYHFRESIASLCRMSIFVVLGTHVDLGALSQYWLPSLMVVIVLMFVARPLVVLVCTLFDIKAKWKMNDKLFMMWVRETGVIPAALSGIVVSMKVPGYEVISSVVFMTILITLIVQASTTKLVAKQLDVLEVEDESFELKKVA